MHGNARQQRAPYPGRVREQHVAFGGALVERVPMGDPLAQVDRRSEVIAGALPRNAAQLHQDLDRVPRQLLHLGVGQRVDALVEIERDALHPLGDEVGGAEPPGVIAGPNDPRVRHVGGCERVQSAHLAQDIGCPPLAHTGRRQSQEVPRARVAADQTKLVGEPRMAAGWSELDDVRVRPGEVVARERVELVTERCWRLVHGRASS